MKIVEFYWNKLFQELSQQLFVASQEITFVESPGAEITEKKISTICTYAAKIIIFTSWHFPVFW